MTAGIGAFDDFFLHTGILDHALEDPSATHQDVVLLLLAEAVSVFGFHFGGIIVAVIKESVRVVELYGANTVMIRVMGVDFGGFVEVVEDFLLKFFETL